MILYGRSYWERVLRIDALVEAGAVSPRDTALFTYAETPEDAFEQLRESLTRFHLEQPGGGSGELPDIAHTRR